MLINYVRTSSLNMFVEYIIDATEGEPIVRLSCPVGPGDSVDWKYQSAGSAVEVFIFIGSTPGPRHKERYVLDAVNNNTLIINYVALNDDGFYHCIDHGIRHTFTVIVNSNIAKR